MPGVGGARPLPASTRQARGGMSRHTAEDRMLARLVILPSSASFIPRPASRPRWTPATSVARGPTCPQRRSCCLAHQQDGAHDGAADNYAQDVDGEHQDAIQYQSVILWTMQGAELVMAGFLRLKARRGYRRQAASPVRAPVRRPACGPSDAMGCVRNAPRHYPALIPPRRAMDQRLTFVDMVPQRMAVFDPRLLPMPSRLARGGILTVTFDCAVRRF
jgi:hypothetical protein